MEAEAWQSMEGELDRNVKDFYPSGINSTQHHALQNVTSLQYTNPETETTIAPNVVSNSTREWPSLNEEGQFVKQDNLREKFDVGSTQYKSKKDSEKPTTNPFLALDDDDW
jgi:hypothetical protein